MHSTFVYGDVLSPLEMCHGKNCVEKIVEHIEDESEWSYANVPHQPMSELNDVFKNMKQQKNRISFFKSLMSLKAER